MKWFSGNRFVNAALVTALVTIALTTLISVRQSKKVEDTSQQVERTTAILTSVRKLIVVTLDVQAAVRGYVITGDEDVLRAYNRAPNDYSFELGRLRSLLGNDSSQLKRLGSMEKYIDLRTRLSDSIVLLRRDQGFKAAADAVYAATGHSLVAEIRMLGEAMEQQANIKLQQSKNGNGASISRLNLILYCTLGLVFILSLIFFIQVRKSFEQHTSDEQRFRALLDAAPDAMIIVSDDGIIRMINQEAENLFQYDRAEMTGQPVEMLIPSSMRTKHELFRSQFTVRGERRPFEGDREMPAERKDGSIFLAEISLSPITTDAGRLVSASVRDITERKKAQEQMELLYRQIDQSNDAIYSLDTTMVATSWNRGAERLFGYLRKEMTGEKPLQLLWASEKTEELNKMLNSIAVNDHWSGDLRCTTRSGNHIEVRTSISAIRDAKGMITGYIAVSHDITVQKSLREQVNYLASIVEQSSEAIISRGLDRRIVSWNKGAEQLFGFRRNDTIGKTSTEIGFTLMKPEELAEMNDIVMSKGTWHSEVPLKHKNGAVFTGDVTANALRNEEGEVTSVVFIVKDISLRKNLELQLRRYNEELEQKVLERTKEISLAERRYRYLFENNPMPMWVMDLNTLRFLDVNDMAVEHYGYSREEFLAMSAADIRPEEEREAFIEDTNQLRDHGHKSSRGSWRHRKKDGTIIAVEVIAHEVNMDGVHARLILANDITERKHALEQLAASEKRFKALIENNYDIITMVDASFGITYRSPAAARLTGWTDEEMMGKNGMMHIHPDDRQRALATLSELMANPGKPIYCQFRNRHKDGHYVWLDGVVVNWLGEEHIRSIVLNFRDVSEKVRAEEKALESEKRYRETLDTMLEGVQILDRDMRYIYVNEAVARQGHATREDMMGKKPGEIYPGVEQTELYQALLRCLNERIPVLMESKFVYPDQSEAWFDISVQPVPEGIFILSVDITEQIRIAAALEDERNKLASIVATSPGLIYSFRILPDGSFSFPYASKSMEDIFGYNADDLTHEVGELFQKADPGEREKLMESIAVSARDLTPWHLEFRYPHPKKGYVWLEGNSIPVQDADGTTTWHGIIIDVTERKKTEEILNEKQAQLQTLSDNLPGVMIFRLLCEPGGGRRFTYISNEAARITGHTPAEVMENPALLYDCIIPGDRERLAAAEEESFRDLTEFKQEIRCRTYTGETRWVSIVSTPHKLQNGNVVWDGFHLDVTERKETENRISNLNAELEKQVQKRTAELKKTNEELEAFTYSVSHDLRAPLRGIIGFTSILEEDFVQHLDAEARRIMTVIKNNTQKMGDLIDDLLSFSRVGRQEVERTRILTNEIVYDAIRALDKKPGQPEPEWIIPELPECSGDANALRQVWVNLVSNAVKYSSMHPQPVIEIGFEEDAACTTFFVKDNGVGFDEKYKAKLFKVFQRLHSNVEFEGTGVGLAIVEKIISKHNGRVWASSEPGKGACFYFCLPKTDTVNQNPAI